MSPACSRWLRHRAELRAALTPELLTLPSQWTLRLSWAGRHGHSGLCKLGMHLGLLARVSGALLCSTVHGPQLRGRCPAGYHPSLRPCCKDGRC